MGLREDRVHVTLGPLMLKEFVLSKKTAGYFDPYHPFGCLMVFAAERTVHTLAVYILINENPREFLPSSSDEIHSLDV